MGSAKSCFKKKKPNSINDEDGQSTRRYPRAKKHGRTPVLSMQEKIIPAERSESQEEIQTPNCPTINIQEVRTPHHSKSSAIDKERPARPSSAQARKLSVTDEERQARPSSVSPCIPNAFDEEQPTRQRSAPSSMHKVVDIEQPTRPRTAPPSVDAFQHQQELEKKDEEIQSLMERLQSMSIEEDKRRNMSFQAGSRTEKQDKNKEIRNLEEKLRQSELEKENLALRLSAAFGARLTNNNPNIADLSDTNRPTKLAEKFSELYDNEWTDAFEALEEAYKKVAPDDETEREKDVDREIVYGLVKMISITYSTCREHADKEMQDIHNTLEKVLYEPLSPEFQKQLTDKRKEKYKAGIEKMRQKVNDGLLAFLSDKWQLKMIPGIMDILKEYRERCLELCWLMVIQDPPVFMDCSNVDKCLKKKRKFQKELYREYTKLGEKIAFVVWPVLYLHESGPVLCKGVAQGRVSKKKKKGKVKPDPEVAEVTNFNNKDDERILFSKRKPTEHLSNYTSTNASLENVDGDLEHMEGQPAANKTPDVGDNQQDECPLPQNVLNT